MPSIMSIMSFPDEMLQMIFETLSVRDIYLAAAPVCKRLVS
jgi:hypothetical protein